MKQQHHDDGNDQNPFVIITTIASFTCHVFMADIACSGESRNGRVII
jgi:hypothetical protein